MALRLVGRSSRSRLRALPPHKTRPSACRCGPGAAVVPIEVPEGAPLAGYSGRGPGNHHQGQLAPVEARALVSWDMADGRGWGSSRSTS